MPAPHIGQGRTIGEIAVAILPRRALAAMSASSKNSKSRQDENRQERREDRSRRTASIP
jgi:hypothetical protein